MEEKYFQSTLDALKANTKEFNSVNLSEYDLGNGRMVLFVEALKENSNIHTLELHGVTGVSSEDWKKLCSVLPSQIKTLDLSCCNLNVEGIFENHLSTALQSLTEIEELDLSGNNFGHLNPHFLTALSSMNQLRELIIHDNNLDVQSCLNLATSIHRTAPLQRVWVHKNQLSSAELPSFIARLSNDSHHTGVLIPGFS